MTRSIVEKYSMVAGVGVVAYDPISLAAISAIAGIAGAGTSAYGALYAGAASKEAASYQAAVAANNQVIANQNAQYSVEAGQQQAEAVSLKGAAQAGKVRAGLAANNIDVNTGSAKNVQTSEAETSQLDTETVLNNAELQAYGYRAAATGYGAESGLLTTQAAEAMPGAELGAGGSLLSNASSVGLKWGGGNTIAAMNPTTVGITG